MGRIVSGPPQRCGVSLASMRADRSQVPAAAAGAAAALAGVGAAELAAGIISPGSSPLASIGAWIIELAPGWAKDVMVALFGTGDKPVLIALIVVGVAAVGALAGFLQSRRPPFGVSLVGVFTLVGVLAAVTRPGAGLLTPLASVVGGVVTVLILRTLASRVDAPVRPELAVRPAVAGVVSGSTDRRGFLRVAGIVSAAGVAAVAAGQFIGASSRRALSAISDVVLPTPATAAPAPSAGASFDIEGLSPLVTSNDAFYRIDTALVVPEIDPSEWSLVITGMVEQEVRVTFDELLALPLEESYTTLMCVSNVVGGDLISTARWLGYPIRELLARAKPMAGADMVLSRSTDGWTAGTPLEVLQDDRNAILAVGMNGAPLPAEHGFPVRMVVPGLYGYVSATKWVVSLEVTRFADAQAYWTTRGWGERGPVKVQSRIDVARAAESGGALIAGVAWAQHTGISGVEVQIDDGEWVAARMADELTIDTWRQWQVTVPLAAGRHTARVRATTSAGEVQTAVKADVLPDGATGYHSRDFTV